MPRININLSLDAGLLHELDIQKEKQGAMSRTALINQALQFYLLAIKLEDNDSPIIGRDASLSIARSLRPIQSELRETNRLISIMLNSIWHRINADSRVTEHDLERLVREAVTEVDSVGFSSVNLLKSAKIERSIRLKQIKEQKNKLHEEHSTQPVFNRSDTQPETHRHPNSKSDYKQSVNENDIYDNLFQYKTYDECK